MMPLGLTPTQQNTYVSYLWSNHDFALSVDVINLNHTPIRSVTGVTLDGQINLQRDAPVGRTATFNFYDPDHSLHLDADSPWEGAVYMDRMIRVRHTVTVPGVGQVTAVPFVGPITKVARDGDVVAVECQDKACLALTGSPPVVAKKGMNAVDGIRRIMTLASGENLFRLPVIPRRPLASTFQTGWHDDAAPWVVCQQIAATLNQQLYYSCDGYLTLRPWPTQAAITADGRAITSAPKVDFDATSVANMVRVDGTLAPPPPQKKTGNAKASPGKEAPVTKLSAVAIAAANHPLAPSRLGRNGVPRYLAVLIEGQQYKTLAAGRALASTTLDRSIAMTAGVSFDMIPVFHLDLGDLIVAQVDAGRVVVRLQEGSIPLAVGGDMSVGTQRAVSVRPGNRITSSLQRMPAAKPAAKPTPKPVAGRSAASHYAASMPRTSAGHYASAMPRG